MKCTVRDTFEEVNDCQLNDLFFSWLTNTVGHS